MAGWPNPQNWQHMKQCGEKSMVYIASVLKAGAFEKKHIHEQVDFTSSSVAVYTFQAGKLKDDDRKMQRLAGFKSDGPEEFPGSCHRRKVSQNVGHI